MKRTRQSLQPLVAVAIVLTAAQGCEYRSVECEFDFECEDHEMCVAGLCVSDDDGSGEGVVPECSEAEVCDGVDNDCDGLIDNEASDAIAWYVDADRDGYGAVSAQVVVACQSPDEYHVAAPGDCNDTDASIHPDQRETLSNGVDDNCDGLELCLADYDNDGYRTDVSFPHTSGRVVKVHHAAAS